jgi:ABC-type dipeptide/oligopeptide/nickel transport system permease subunit
MQFIAAAKVSGAGNGWIILHHILPNCLSSVIVLATLTLGDTILIAASLSFIGLGAQPPSPEWGSMLSNALEFIQRAWWVVTFPGLMILLTVLAFNLMGDGLRDALDPKMKS